MAESTYIKKMVWSSVMGVFILAGGFMLFVTLFLLYVLSLIFAYRESVPDGSWSFLLQIGMICSFLYLVGGFLWNLKRKREPSVDKNGRLLFSASFFLTGGILLLIVVFLATRPHSMAEQVNTNITWVNAWVGSVCLFLMGFSLYIWIKTKKRTQKTMVCPQCGLYVPEDMDSCPRCGTLVK